MQVKGACSQTRCTQPPVNAQGLVWGTFFLFATLELCETRGTRLQSASAAIVSLCYILIRVIRNPSRLLSSQGNKKTPRIQVESSLTLVGVSYW